MSQHGLPQDFVEVPIGDKPYPAPATIDQKSSLADILAFARQQGASDVHLTPNNPVIVRKFSRLTPVSEPVPAARAEEILEKGLPATLWAQFQEDGDLELVHTVSGSGRFRMTLMRQRFGIDMTARVIPRDVMTWEQARIPDACKSLTHWAQGLVLITGPSGCGKTMTLSGLINMMNKTRQDHIITIENPIEFVFKQDKCQITQREINKHTLSQGSALRAALREDPDIIIVSELRDLESIQLAVSAAETGHLVLGTMNTNDAAQTISKLIFSFPADERSVITNMISESLRGVISQQLIPTADGKGLVPAFEVLIVSQAIASMIRESKFMQINNAIAMGKSSGMVLLDNSLQALVSSGAIEKPEAYRRAINPKLFEDAAAAGGNLGSN